MNTPKTPKPLKVRPPKDPHHLRALDYEVAQLARAIYCAQELPRLVGKVEDREHWITSLMNALVASIAVHMRNIADFLNSAPKSHDTDLLAVDFQPGWLQSAPALTETEYKRVNKEVAHLTDIREEGSDEKEAWDRVTPLRVLARSLEFYLAIKRPFPITAQGALDDAERKGVDLAGAGQKREA